MKHTLPLIVLLSLLLSTTAWTSAQGQTAITMDPLMDWPEQLGAGPVGTVSQWLASSKTNRARRWAHPAFRIRLGRSFTITVPKS
ncbi:MAG: hypothetical protein ABI432_07825 [Flavobacteriales bacterium]